jgi:putative transposase
MGGMGPGEGENAEGMAEGEALSEALAGLVGKPAIYHCVSRVVDRNFVLQRGEKERFVELMRIYERFCQVRVLTFCVMINHFHILLEVPAAPEDGGASWSDGEFLKHLSGLYGERDLGGIRWELEHLRGQKAHEAAEGLRQRYFERMWDLSSFMKTLKQRFTQWFNGRHDRQGYLWSERFKSVLVEDGHAARTVAAYIDLNPVRAGVVSDAKDYRWSGYGEAVTGNRAAREGLQMVLFENWSGLMNKKRAAEKAASWREVVRKYRMVLFDEGEEREGDCGKGRAGISASRAAQVLAKGGKLSEKQLIYCKARHFVDGMVIGSEEFVNRAFALSRECFGASRQSGARKLRGVRTELRTLRDLQKNPVSI